jgi:hypothetical protein
MEKKLPTLNISGLSRIANEMECGGTYFLILDTPSIKTSLMIGSLKSALEDNIPSVLILNSTSDVSSISAKASWGDLLNSSVDSGLLKIFMHDEHFKANIFRYGVNRFNQDLEFLNLQCGSFIWFDFAEQLFTIQDIHFAAKQVKIVVDWLKMKQVTAVFVFAKLNNHETHDIHLLSEHLSGMCRIGGGSRGLEAKFLHWHSLEGDIALKNYALEESNSGFYRTSLPTSSSSLEKSSLHINLDPSVAECLASTSVDWIFLDSPLKLIHKLRDSPAPTIVLRFGFGTNILDLAQSVHTLRTVIGRGAKIIVHEDGLSLRHSYELLLLSLGANFVMHREIPVWRLPLIVKSLEDTLFNRDIDVPFDALMLGVEPTQLTGALNLFEFIEQVETVLTITKENKIPVVLFKGLTFPAQVPEEILKEIKLSRVGDLCACDDSSVYIFLLSCPAYHLKEIFDRIFSVSLDSIFINSNSWTSPEAITDQLEKIRLTNIELIPKNLSQSEVSAPSKQLSQPSSENSTLTNIIGEQDLSILAPENELNQPTIQLEEQLTISPIKTNKP